MLFQLLQLVALVRDLPANRLRKGDLGAIVHIYEPDGLEVEFVRASDKAQAVVTLNVEDVRTLDDADVIAVRRI